MGPMKNRRRSKSFLCFRSIDIDDGSVKPDLTDGKGGQVFDYISVVKQGEEKMVIPKILTSLSEGKLNVSPRVGGRRNKERSRQSLSRILKAVFFETSLARSNKERQSKKSAKTKKVPNSVNEKLRESSESNDRSMNYSRWSSNSSSSTTVSTPFSSSCVTSSSNSRSSSERKGSFRAISVEPKQEDRMTTSTEKVRQNYMVACLLFICLLVLILWGRVCAILCTSICFFLVPSCIKRVGSPAQCVCSLEMNSEEQKKKVVMGGLLERNRSRVL